MKTDTFKEALLQTLNDIQRELLERTLDEGIYSEKRSRLYQDGFTDALKEVALTAGITI